MWCTEYLMSALPCRVWEEFVQIIVLEGQKRIVIYSRRVINPGEEVHPKLDQHIHEYGLGPVHMLSHMIWRQFDGQARKSMLTKHATSITFAGHNVYSRCARSGIVLPQSHTIYRFSCMWDVLRLICHFALHAIHCGLGYRGLVSSLVLCPDIVGVASAFFPSTWQRCSSVIFLHHVNVMIVVSIPAFSWADVYAWCWDVDLANIWLPLRLRGRQSAVSLRCCDLPRVSQLGTHCEAWNKRCSSWNSACAIVSKLLSNRVCTAFCHFALWMLLSFLVCNNSILHECVCVKSVCEWCARE